MVTLLAFWASLRPGQQLSPRISNQDVIDMVSLGLSDDVIIDKIHATPAAEFDTSVAALRTLKAAKVSDAVIRAMINPHPADSVVSNTSAASGTNNTLPQEVGVYVILGGKLTEIEPEIVNWQTGGWAKSHASLGIVKGDVNGKITKDKSQMQVSDNPVEFVIKTLEGTSVTEYQLLRLHEKSDRREFRAATGGVIHMSGGAEGNEVRFSPEKIGSRTWKITLSDLPRGEYGFLPPGMESRSIASSGKIYTFGSIEGSGAGLWNISKNHTNGGTSTQPSDPATSPPTFKEASIGAFCAENPNVRRDGLTLTSVNAGGPADQVGIRAGDVILAIDDHYLFTAAELQEEISHHQPGSKIIVRYRQLSTINASSVMVGRAQ
jgi:hypothetical protein